MLIRDVEVIQQCLSPKQSRPCYVISIKMNESLMVRDIGFNQISIGEKVCMRESARFRDETWLHKIEESSTKKRVEHCKNKDGIFMLCMIQGHSGVPIEPELMGYVFIRRNLKRHTFHRGLSRNFQSILGNGLIPGGKEKDKARQAVSLTPTNPSGNDLEEEESRDDYIFCYSLETRPRCSTLDTIVKSARSRIGILADEVICNQDLRYDAWRQY